MAKILLTGAFGNVGTSTLNELVKHNHHIRCFDIPTKRNKKKARKFKNFQGKIEFFWGDLRNSLKLPNQLTLAVRKIFLML
ncbi:MAG: hypothetical protein ACTSP7_13965 [Candidatus Heimdallarchaeota archaeon]